MSKILIIEDDLTFATMIKAWLGRKGFVADSVSTVARGISAVKEYSPHLILCDMRLPDGEGLDVLDFLKKESIATPLIVMTGYADVQNAVNAMKHGAVDYIAKPVQPELLLEKINGALAANDTAPVANSPRNTVVAAERFYEGNSEAARRLYGYVALVAPTPMSVLITGANGTGKEYVAHRIHQLSRRSDKPFVAIDCGALFKELAASELFGHIKGSFTGAVSDKAGAFIEANGGTLFLDEVGNLSYDVQVQLLRAIQERKIRQVGSTKEVEVDVRIVCATNKNLLKAIADGEFREDLYHRINEFNLEMPLLKDRGDDILEFATFFLNQANKELERHIVGFSPEASNVMLHYSWPGNLRQMKNVIKRATLVAQGSFITVSDLGSEFSSAQPVMTLRDASTERELIIKALEAANHNKAQAARILGIDRKTLYNKLKLYNL